MLSLGTDAGTPKVQKWSSAASSFVTPSSDVVSTLSVFFHLGACFFHVFFTCDEENWGLLWLSLACIGNNWNMFEFDVKSLAIDIM
jgi:hypothetical protein